MLAPIPRLVISAILFSAWMMLLFFGNTFGGTIYLLFFASLALFPWRMLKQ